jgi:hypothetical protein
VGSRFAGAWVGHNDFNQINLYIHNLWWRFGKGNNIELK